MRADRFLYTHGFAKSRSHATALIASGVTLGEIPIKKPSQEIPEHTDPSLVVILNPSKYVSRGGIKLEAAISAFSWMSEA